MTLTDKHEQTHYHDALLNASPPTHLMAEEVITPNNLFFVRNHAPIPEIDPATYRLQVIGMVGQALSLSLDDLRANFTEYTLTATLQCAGNRRQEMLAHKPIDDQLAWGIEAIGNATWTGVRLADVLAAAGTDDAAAHVAFLGLDHIHKDGERKAYGSSIELHKARQPEVLLAYAMNGEPLPAAHGGPLRALVPGYIGARSVKWISEISVQAEPSDNYFQQVAYKLFPPTMTPQTVDYAEGIMLTTMPLTAAIVRPDGRETLAAGTVRVEGYAMSDGAHPVTWVEVSADGGASWQRATLRNAGQQWSWQLWQLDLQLAAGQHELVVRAWDSAAHKQPETIDSVWNFKGYANNAWHRLTLTVR